VTGCKPSRLNSSRLLKASQSGGKPAARLAHCLSRILNSASTVRLPGQDGIPSGKRVLSPSGGNGLPGLATIPAHILRQCE
jgi:hypothetical protein